MELLPQQRTLTDRFVTLRSVAERDRASIIAGRDKEFHRFMGEGSSMPEPTAIVRNREGEIVGWIDCDTDRSWLTSGEVNVGYNTFPEHRGQGYAQAALLLLLPLLAENADLTSATLLIDPANAPSRAVARRAGFVRDGDVDGQHLYKRSLRSLR